MFVSNKQKHTCTCGKVQGNISSQPRGRPRNVHGVIHACFFVFLTILDEKKFEILMDLIWADVSTEFEAPPFWLFLLLESLLTFQQLW